VHRAHLWVFVIKPKNPLLKNFVKFIEGRILGHIHTKLSLEEIIV
jgi:hypothetical protein